MLGAGDGNGGIWRRTRPVRASVGRRTGSIEKNSAAGLDFRYPRRMLDLTRIAEVAQEVARETFGGKWVKDIQVKPISEWTGEDALEVRVVLDESAVPQLSRRGKASAMLNRLGERLYGMGEPRFAHVRYATQKELDSHGDSEP